VQSIVQQRALRCCSQCEDGAAALCWHFQADQSFNESISGYAMHTGTTPLKKPSLSKRARISAMLAFRLPLKDPVPIALLCAGASGACAERCE
jgi:hypothetical protein